MGPLTKPELSNLGTLPLSVPRMTPYYMDHTVGLTLYFKIYINTHIYSTSELQPHSTNLMRKMEHSGMNLQIFVFTSETSLFLAKYLIRI